MNEFLYPTLSAHYVEKDNLCDRHISVQIDLEMAEKLLNTIVLPEIVKNAAPADKANVYNIPELAALAVDLDKAIAAYKDAVYEEEEGVNE